MFISRFSSVLRIVLANRQVETQEPEPVPEPIVVHDDRETRQCEWCSAEFHPASVKNRFDTEDCRKAAESVRRKEQRRARASQKKEEPQPEPEPVEPPRPRLVKMEVVTPSRPEPVASQHMNQMESEAKCSEPGNISLPWTAGDASYGDLRRMMATCLECPILNKCALYAQTYDASGVWAAASLNMGRTRLWMCPSCRALNEGHYDLCAACKRASIPFRARATIATREGRNIYPKRKPIEIPIQVGSPAN